METLSDYTDALHIRPFQHFAGEFLESLDQIEIWDIITVLCQAASFAHADDCETIATDGLAEMMDLELSENAAQCLKLLNHFPESQVNRLIKALIEMGFPEDLEWFN